jgi:hypothetical protein
LGRFQSVRLADGHEDRLTGSHAVTFAGHGDFVFALGSDLAPSALREKRFVGSNGNGTKRLLLVSVTSAKRSSFDAEPTSHVATQDSGRIVGFLLTFATES